MVIRTPDHRLRVFVSSTLKELAEERLVAKSAIDRLRMAPVMFESGARPHQASALYKAYVQQSHIFIGIYGEQYGWIAPTREISGLEEEYHLAEDKPRLIYILKPAPDRDPKLTTLLQHIRDKEGISYKYFSSAEELQTLIENDLALILSERFESIESKRQEDPSGWGAWNIPVPPTPLLGRDDEIDQLRKLLINEGLRLITLTGPGGSGKTRLSIEIGNLMRNNFDGSYFVELGSVHDSGLVVSQIAHQLGLREAGTKTSEKQITEFIGSGNILLILDNYEQILDSAPLVSRFLQRCNHLRIIVTSRFPLRVRGEYELPVTPLSLPDSEVALSSANLTEYPSTELFYRCAVAANCQFDWSEENIQAAAEICRKVDGLPLAIELAAARTRILPPRAIMERMKRSLPLLTGGSRDLPERQRTMRNTIAWSYNLLEENVALLFCRLGVFRGGWTLEAAEAVCNQDRIFDTDMFELLESLVDSNLIRIRGSDEGEPRFDMMETIREFATEQLQVDEELQSLEEAHGLYYTKRAQEAEPHYRSNRRDIWLLRTENDLDNIRAVITRSLERRINPEYGLKILGELGWFCHLRGYLSEGRQWSGQLLEMPEAAGPTQLRAKALFPDGGLAWSQSDYLNARSSLEESVALFKSFGNQYWQVQSQVLLAASMASLGAYDEAYELSREAVRISREIPDRWGEAYSLYWYGDISFLTTNNSEVTRECYRESLNLYQTLEDPWGIAEVQGHLGIIALYEGALEEAEHLLKESLAFMETIEDRWAVARGLSGLGSIYLAQNAVEQARQVFRRGIEVWHNLGNVPGMMICLTGIAKVAVAQGEYELAARLLTAVTDVYRVVGILIVPGQTEEHERLVNSVRNMVPENRWHALQKQAEESTLEQIITTLI